MVQTKNHENTKDDPFDNGKPLPRCRDRLVNNHPQDESLFRLNKTPRFR